MPPNQPKAKNIEKGIQVLWKNSYLCSVHSRQPLNFKLSGVFYRDITLILGSFFWKSDSMICIKKWKMLLSYSCRHSFNSIYASNAFSIS